MFEFQSVRRPFPRNLAENSEAASFLDQTTSFETEVQEREPWDFYEWITCKVAYLLSYTVSAEKMWTQNTCIIHDV
jgi:sigma54-dependent transcription regulator